jgi:hypothetical protein
VLRRSNSEYLKAKVDWKSIGKTQREHPKKWWIDEIKQDIKKLGILN